MTKKILKKTVSPEETLIFNQSHHYGTPEPYTFKEVLDRTFYRTDYYSGKIEDVEAKVENLFKIVEAMTQSLPDSEKIRIAKALYYDPISNAEDEL